MTPRRVLLTAITGIACVALATASIQGRKTIATSKRHGPDPTMVLDGSTVHNVGQLHMHVGNWGMFR